MYSMFALLECVCEQKLSHQTASIKPLQKGGPYMPMAVLIRARKALDCRIFRQRAKNIHFQATQ